MDYVGIFNFVEALWWTVLAVVLLVMARRHPSMRFRTIPASLTLLLFAAEEVGGLQTGT